MVSDYSITTLIISNVLLAASHMIATVYGYEVFFQKKIRSDKRWLLIISVSTIQGIIGTYLSYESGAFISFGHYVLIFIIYAIVETLAISHTMKQKVIQTFALSAIIGTMNLIVLYVVFFLYHPLYFGVSNDVLAEFSSYLICTVLTLALFKLISKTKIPSYTRYLLKNTPLSLFIGAFPRVVEFAGYYVKEDTNYELINIGISLVYLFVWLFLSFVARDFFHKERLVQTETTILEQRIYLQSLEEIQQNLRTIHHDYKNIMAGLYLHADKGNLEEIKKFIHSIFLGMDDSVEKSIYQANQLSNIKLIELKSLILTKMFFMEKKKINFCVEVFYPVTDCSLPLDDLLRCIGILLDNAIEEVEKLEDATISFTLLQHDNTLTITIQNPLYNHVDLGNIWRRGYSTKGKNRGLGLSIIDEIINQ